MPAPTISDLPAAPSRSDPATFSDRADTFVAALATFKTELNAYANYMDNLAILADGGLYEVQSSPTDTGSGKLLKTGAFGLGTAISLTATDDLNALTASGLYYNPTGGNVAGNNYPISSAGSLLNIRRSSANWTQLFTKYVNNDVRQYVRSYGSTGWSAWREIYNAGSILGTVSQSGGVPTGAVVERGSNANGEYVRFADGTQICWKTIDIPSLDINTATGNVFVSASQLLGSTAASFLTTPAFSFSTSVLNAYSWCASGGLGAPTSFPQVQFFRSTAITGRAARICATAVGRWF